MEFLLTDKMTAAVIKDDQIVSQTDAGIVQNTADCWKFIPTKNIKQDKIYTEYYTAEAVPVRNINADMNPYLANSDPITNIYKERLETRFGFKNLKISTRIAAPTSVILSNPIDVTYTDYVTIECEIENEEAGTAEFYIIDRTDEIPILPNRSQQIIKERIFLEEDTRFPVNTEKNITLYEDNWESQKAYSSLTAEDFKNHVYALTYTTDHDYSEYTPIGNTITIKIIIRQYAADKLFKIKNFMLHKHGDTPAWNLQQ